MLGVFSYIKKRHSRNHVFLSILLNTQNCIQYLSSTKLNLFLVLQHRPCLFVGSLSSHSDALCLRSYAQMFLPFRGHSYARCAHIFMLSRSNAIMFPIRLLKVNFHRRLVIHDTSSLLWSSPRPISDSQLHVLPHFHLCPIYLVVFKGSYWINSRDILS